MKFARGGHITPQEANKMIAMLRRGDCVLYFPRRNGRQIITLDILNKYIEEHGLDKDREDGVD